MSTPESDSFVQQDISTSDLDDALTEVDSLVSESPEQHNLPTCLHRDILQGEKPDILLVRESIQAILQNFALFITVTIVTFRLILVILRHLASPQRAERIPLLRRLASAWGALLSGLIRLGCLAIIGVGACAVLASLRLAWQALGIQPRADRALATKPFHHDQENRDSETSTSRAGLRLAAL